MVQEEIQLHCGHWLKHKRQNMQLCVSSTYYRACILILNVYLPEQSALVVLIHDAWTQEKTDQHNHKIRF